MSERPHAYTRRDEIVAAGGSVTPLEFFRVYEPHELGADGYPYDWHRCQGCAGSGQVWLGSQPYGSPGESYMPCPRCLTAGAIKHLVRAIADNRCVRCGHPYRVGESGEWESVTAEVGRRLEYLVLFAEEGNRPEMLEPPAGATNWSDCDELCTHGGPLRAKYGRDPWAGVTDELITAQDELAGGADRVQAAYRILTVHHLNERKHDCRWWNLVSTCQRCHLYLQRKVQLERVYPFEHTPWFKPYAAGWYAYAYEGRNLTREEAEADLERLLALERMA